MTPQELKISILQSALQGKLVPHMDDEGTGAAEILKMSQDKQRLIKAKLIKKEKELGDVEETDKPYDVPDTWIWIKVGNVGSWSAGATPSRSNPDYYGGDIPWLKTGDLNDGYVAFVPEFISQLALEKTSVRLNPAGSVLMAMYGATIGKLAILEVPMTTNQACCACIPYEGIYNKYLFYFLMGNRTNFIKMGEGGAQPNISKDKIVNYPIAIPPLAEQKRIVAKIEELLPYIDRYGEAFTKLEEFNKRFPVDMQKSILQTAIQGKLVEQRLEEGTGEELYQQIQSEKQQLIKDKRIKKEKPLPEIGEDEIPFEIPENWKWVRLSEICNISDGTHQTPKYVEKGMPFISAQNVKPYSFLPEVHRDVSYEDYCVYNKMVSPEKDDILMTRVGAGIGEAAIIDLDFEFSIYVSLTLIKCYLKGFDMRYILHVLNSPLGIAMTKKKTLGKGASQGNLNLCFIREFVFPLPPYEEQKRISKKLDEILPICRRLR